MNIDVKQLSLKVSDRYPYTHRVEVKADAFAADKVKRWLDESEISYVNPFWGVYYLDSKATNMLVLRWS